MTMYGLMFGQNPASDAILATLGLRQEDVGRFRDCFVCKGEIAVYTRNGGGNRECSGGQSDVDRDGDCVCVGCQMQNVIPKHSNYLRDEDDSFDSTYATIYYSFPTEFAEELKQLDNGEAFEPSKRWLDAIASVRVAR